jgi:type I restriction enzyme S subunit
MKSANWKRLRLDELGFVGRGKSRHRPRNDPSLYGGPYPFIQTADIMAANPYIATYSQTYSEFGFRQSKVWPRNTLCMTIAGANTAKVAILTFNACFPDSVVGFIPDKSKADLHFVLYSLSLMKDQFLAVSRGATQDNLGLDKLLSFPLLVPDLAEQQRIAAILSAYDERIENNKQRIVLLERLAEEIYREWFVRFRFPGHQLLKRFKGVPAGWTPTPSNEVFRVMGGGTPRTDNAVYWDGEIPFFTPRDAGDNFYVLNTERRVTQKGLESCNSPLFKKDTIFITARGTVGKICLAHREMAMNQTCYALSPIEKGDVYFHFLSMKNAIAYIKGVSKSGVFDNIIVDTFKIIPILMPPASLIIRFNECVTPVFSQIGVLLESNEVLTKTRDLLLPRLISGKLSVEDIDIQFPDIAEQLRAGPTRAHA